MKRIPFATHACAMPLVVHYDKPGSYGHFGIDKDSVLVLNGKEIARSLAANNIIKFQGLIEKPHKTKYFEFSEDKRKNEISFLSS